MSRTAAGAAALAIENAGDFDLDTPSAAFLAAIPWEGPPARDPDALSAGDFFEGL